MEPEKKSNGALVGLIIIVIILVIGGIYMYQMKSEEMEKVNTETESVNPGDSAELNTLDAELNATDTSTGVDVETVY